MAQQDGIFKIKGTLGGVTFYKTQDGYMTREKGGISRKRMATDPAFRRTRENGQEFGTAGKYGKYLRNAVRTISQNSSDKRIVARMVKSLMTIIKTDVSNPRGLRTPVDGEFGLLKGFEFNANAQLTTTLYAPYQLTLDVVSGNAQVEIPDMIATQLVKAPAGTTHFKVVAAAAEIDFIEGNSILATESTAEILYNDALVPAITLNTNITAATDKPVVQLVGIEFFQEVNGVFYILNNGTYNALAVVNAVKP